MGLMLHCGAELVSLNEVASVPTPEATQTWHPVPHITIVDEVQRGLRDLGLDILQEEHALAKEGARYFGLFELADRARASLGRATQVCLRNGHDKSIAIDVGVGNRVFCCDNLSFSALVRLHRKHTRHARRELRGLVTKALSRVRDFETEQDYRISCYQDHALTPEAASHLVVSAVQHRVMPAQQIMPVVTAWEKPEHEEFAGRNLWSLFNAFTGVMKDQGTNINTVVSRTQHLHGLFDTVAGCDFTQVT